MPTCKTLNSGGKHTMQLLHVVLFFHQESTTLFAILFIVYVIQNFYNVNCVIL